MVQLDGFCGYYGQKISDKATMKAAGGGAHGHNPLAVQDKHRTGSFCNNAYWVAVKGSTGKGFCKKPRRFQSSHNGTVAVIIIPHHLHRALQHNAHVCGCISFPKNSLILFHRHPSSPKTAQQGSNLSSSNTSKKGAAGKNRMIHGITGRLPGQKPWRRRWNELQRSRFLPCWHWNRQKPKPCPLAPCRSRDTRAQTQGSSIADFPST